MKSKLLTLTIMMAAFAALAQPKEFSFKQDYEVKSPATLKLSVVDSDIKTIGSDDGKIEVFYIVSKKNELQNLSFEELKEYFTIEIKELDNGLELTAKPTLKNTKLNWDKRYNLDFYIKTPKTTSCNLSTVDGDLRIKTLKGKQEFKTVDGNIEYIEAIGDVVAKTVDGRIKGYKLKGNQQLKTIDGDIQIEGIIGNVNSKTTDGEITVKLAKGEISATTIDGDVYVAMAAIENAISIKTVDGDIDLLLPDKKGFNLNMKGEDLNANFKNFDGNVDDNSIEGKVNGGGELIKITTVDGDVDLKFADQK